jgi:hypothetical protein
MRTDQLIAGLTRDLKPVAVLPSPAIRLGQWLAVLPLLVAPGAMVWGLRDDLAAVLEDRVQLTWAALALATSCTAAWSALRLAVPGARGVAMAVASSLAAVVLWIATLANEVTSGAGFAAGAMAWPYPVCIVKVASIALMPAVALLVMLRQAAPLEPGLTSGMAVLAATAAGALGAQIACPNGLAAHVLLGHVGPMVGLSILAAVLRIVSRPTRRT